MDRFELRVLLCALALSLTAPGAGPFSGSSSTPFDLEYTVSANDVNFCTAIGDTTSVKQWNVRIANSVTLGSTSTTTPGAQTGSGCAAGSSFYIYLDGADARIQGKGGTGGTGAGDGSFCGGGGGGGAGTQVGTGGGLVGTCGGGNDGTATAGGTGGAGDGSATGRDCTAGGNGGEALDLQYPTIIAGTGDIWGGGGAGSGGDVLFAGGPGGDPGAGGTDTCSFAGVNASTGGDAYDANGNSVVVGGSIDVQGGTS